MCLMSESKIAGKFQKPFVILLNTLLTLHRLLSILKQNWNQVIFNLNNHLFLMKAKKIVKFTKLVVEFLFCR